MARNDQVMLSAAGRARRDAMRDELAHEVVRVSRRRRAVRRAAVATTALVLAGVGAWWAASVMAPAPTAAPPLVQAPSITDDPSPETARVHVEIIRETPQVLPASLLQIRVAAAEVSISDDELLRELAELGRQTGLAVVGGRATLTAPVTDEAIRARQSEPEIPIQDG